MLFFFKQKTAYEMRISDWSSDVCSSDLLCPDPNPPFGRPDGSAALYWKDPPSASSRRSRSMRPDEYRWVASLDAETSQQNARHAPHCRRSEERRVGKECVSTGRSRWSPYT